MPRLIEWPRELPKSSGTGNIEATMKVQHLHDWQVSPSEAIAIQERLVNRVSEKDDFGTVRLIAGIDVSVSRFSKAGRAAVVVLDYPQLRLVESQTVENEIIFPYIPGLLSFREGPVCTAAVAKLKSEPDVFIIDGQGIAHPRRLGLAAHLGLLFDKPTIGWAKSRLTGHFEEPPPDKGTYSTLKDKEETIGAVVRTRTDVKPVFVSVGNKCRLKDAIEITSTNVHVG